jgi:hypothetical protein
MWNAKTAFINAEGKRLERGLLWVCCRQRLKRLWRKLKKMKFPSHT